MPQSPTNSNHPERYRTVHLLTLGVIIMAAVMGCREQPSDSSRSAGTQPDTVSVAFYNVENLFDLEFDGHEYPEYRPDPSNWNQAAYDARYENIASVIAALDAGILGLCEVEDADALGHLAEVLKKKGHAYQYRYIGDSAATGNTHPALLSRFPITRTVIHPVVLPEGVKTREILEADIAVRGKTLKLFVNHWPSKHHAESFRVAAADSLLSLLSSLPKQTDYIVLGDFNSDVNEFSTFSASGHNDTKGITGINTVLGTTNRISAVTSRIKTLDEVLSSPFPSHYDLWMELPDAVRMSYFYKGNRQTPDHILLPPSLFDTTGFSYLDNSFNSFTWGSRLLKNGAPIGWQFRYSGKMKYHVGEGYSDHLPIIAKFITAPYTEATGPVDFNEAFSTESSNPDSWFEFNTSGFIACENRVLYVRDTVTSVAGGNYALHVAAPAAKDNYSALRAVIPAAYRTKKGELLFYLRGSGDICFRTKNGDAWTYHDIVKKTASGRASYPPFKSALWQTITITPRSAATEDVEIELRCGRNTPLDLWIDR